MNSFNGIGRLTADPKVVAFNKQDGTQGYFSHATLAVDYFRGGEKKAAFIPVTIPGVGATNLKKASKIAISAEVEDASYTDENGVKHFGIRFFVNSWEYAESKKEGAQPQTTQAAPATAQPQAAQPIASQVPVTQPVQTPVSQVSQAPVVPTAQQTQMPAAQNYGQPQNPATYPNVGMPGVPANPAGAMTAPMPQNYGMNTADMMQAEAVMQMELPFN